MFGDLHFCLHAAFEFPSRSHPEVVRRWRAPQPTNHLDLPAILWLQRYLSGLTGTTLVAVSHDRAFLNAVCDEMIVLRGGGLAYHSGNYDEYVQVPDARVGHICSPSVMC